MIIAPGTGSGTGTGTALLVVVIGLVVSSARVETRLGRLAAGMLLYDALALFRNVRVHRMLGKRGMLEAEPMLRERGLRGGARFYDAQCDDARLVVATARSAMQHGALVSNYMAVTALERTAGRVVGAQLEDRVTGERGAIRACDALCVPGQGIFGRCMTNLFDNGFDALIRDWVAAERPYLGICLGLQVLFDDSEEDESCEHNTDAPHLSRRSPSTAPSPRSAATATSTTPIARSAASTTSSQSSTSSPPAPNGDSRRSGHGPPDQTVSSGVERACTSVMIRSWYARSSSFPRSTEA